MKKFYQTLFFAICLGSTLSFAQPGLQWESRYNGPGAVDKGNLIALDDFGNIYVAGVSDAANYFSDYLLIKYNPDGDTLWTRRYNGTANLEDVPMALKVDDNNNVYVTGKSKGAGTGYDIVTIKYNPNGIQQWVAVFNGDADEDDIGYGLETDAAGNVYLVGSSYYYYGSTATDGVVIKYNAAGNLVWEINTNQSSGNEIANLIAINKNNGNVMVAVGLGEFGDGDFHLMELNPFTGATIMIYNPSNIYSVRGFPDAMALDPGGNIFVTSTDTYVSNNPNYVHTSKFNYGIATKAWDFYRYTSNSNSQFHGIDLKVDVNSNPYILYNFYNNQYYYWITEKLNTNGNTQWNKNFSSSSGVNDYAISLQLGSNPTNPNVYVTGYSSTGNIHTVKYLNNGNLDWTISYDCGNNGVDAVADMAIDSMENLYLTGHSSCNGTYQDIKTLKYCTTVPEAVITANGPTSFCPGGSVQLSVDTCAGCTYLWSPGGATTATINANPSATTNYTVEVTSPADCSATSEPFTVTVLTPNPISITGDTDICEGESTILTASGATNYSWLPTTGVDPPNSASPEITPTATQTYTVSGVSSNGCPVSAEVTITVTPLPDVTAQGESPICLEASAQLSASGADTYSWSPAGSLDNPNIYNPIATPSAPTTYIVTGTTNGCSDTATFTVNVIIVELSGLPANAILCNGDTIFNLGASGAATYSWFPTTGLSDPNVANPAIFPTSTTTYTVTGTTAGCTDQATITITVKPKPTVSAGANPTIICDEESIQLTSSGAPAYTWTPAQYLDNPNLQNPVATPPVGTTTFTVTGDLNGCTNTASVEVTVNPIPVVTLAGPTYPVCPGVETMLFAYSDIPVDTWQWEPSESLNDPNIATPVASPSETTTYEVTATVNGCSGTSTITVEVKPLPNQPGVISGSTTVCSGKTETYTIETVAGATAYNWLLPSGWTGTPNMHSIEAVPSEEDGVISVAAVNECGQSLPSSLPVTANKTPDPPAFTVDGITLSTEAEADIYHWYRNDTLVAETVEAEYIAEISGEYQLAVTKDDCTSEHSASQYVEVISGTITTGVRPILISLFPNPTTGILTIQASGIESGPFHLQISNSLGQEVMEWRGKSHGGALETRLDLSGFAGGVYFINIRSDHFQYSEMVYKI